MHLIGDDMHAPASPDDAAAFYRIAAMAIRQRRWSEAVCREYGIVPGDVRFVSSYALLATRVGRGEGFSIDSKMFDTPASPMKLTYLPVKWALSGTVVMAWRRHHVPEHVTRFVEFLRPGTTENEEWTV